jgi:hypothetical protein
LKRRDFLKGAALVAAGAGSGLGASLVGLGQARAAFGEAPAAAKGALIPEELRAESILEIFLYGGVSQYETFYNVLEHGQSNGTGWYLFLKNGDVDAAVNACGLGGEALTVPFAPDANGKMVNLGPFVVPLRQRQDVLDRTRIIVTSHGLAPHEAAIPYTMGGHPLGTPNLAGLGSHIQRYFTERDGSVGRAPYSYVLLPSSSVLVGLTGSSIAVGNHPSTSRPLQLKLDAVTDFYAQLSRPGIPSGDRANYDALIKRQIERYQARLRWKGAGERLRAPYLDNLSGASSSMANVDTLQAVLDPKYFMPVPGSSCGKSALVDTTAMSLNLAAHLLTHETSPAKYVCVIDGGLVPASDAGGYDAHADCTSLTASNLPNTLRALMDIINKPGENDKGKLDLNKTMIMITTEFGRTPFEEGAKGRGHWPGGYPVLFIGGPVQKKGIYGAAEPDGPAQKFSSPPENRIAALLALGIWPFNHDSFAIGDVTNAMSEADGATQIQNNQLGLSG